MTYWRPDTPIQRRGKPILFPIRLDDTVLDATSGWTTDVKGRFIGDFSAWETPAVYQEAFERLLRDLKAEGAKDDDQTPQSLSPSS